MKTFTIVPRGNKYWVEEVDEDTGLRRRLIAFGSEEAAVICLKDYQRRQSERA